ncbi:MAG: two-component regulator propeller domain-containing protein [Bacteroidales bacterium]
MEGARRSGRFSRWTPGRWVLFLLLLPGATGAMAQQFFFQQYSVSEGLAQSTVYEIIQDRDDNYWLGTQVGVSRFDGMEFRNFSEADGLAVNGIRAICEDRSGNLWFGHATGGVTRYRNRRFEVFASLKDTISSYVTDILEDSLEQLWITTFSSGVLVLENPDAPLADIRYRHFTGSQISDRVTGGFVNRKGDLYFVADPNTKVRMAGDSLFRNLVLNGVPKYHATTSVLVDREGNTWVGKYNGGLFRYDPRSDSTTMFDLVEAGGHSNWVSTIFEDRQGRIWAGTWGGGLACIRSGGDVRIYNEENGLRGLKVWSLTQDREGNLLIGTQENGMLVFKGEQFVSFGPADGLADPQVWSILEHSNGEFWFGTNNGISILAPGKDPDRFHSLSPLSPTGLPGRTDKGRIIGLKEDSRGTVWVGSASDGVYRMAPGESGRFDPRLNNYIRDLNVTAMDLDGRDRLWVGTLDGLLAYDLRADQVVRFTQVNGLRGNEVSAVFVDSRDRVWVGSQGKGLSVVLSDTILQVDLGSTATPRTFAEDRDGILWIGTEGRGIVLFDPETMQVTGELTSGEHGLLANLINLLRCDRDNNMYIGTNEGLNVYVRDQETLVAFTHSSGFTGIETRQNASLVDSEGNLWFGTVEGVTRFVPSDFSQTLQEPRTRITSFVVDHEEYPLGREARLSYKQNSIAFEYRSISLNPDAQAYQFMLEGVDEEWRDAHGQTEAVYPALPPGAYTFLVQARSSAGIWNREAASYRFSIRPPFYLTWYFILSMILLLTLAIFAYVKIRERALRRENAWLEETVRDRTAVVVAQKEELAQKNKDITDSIRYAKRIQFSILPEESPFPGTFILFKPKDIVSGDFYWFTEVDGKEFFAAVDCTGHGVPGAFMSIIGHNSLTKIVREYGILEPGEILTQLNKEVQATLHLRSDVGDVYDGMDLALVAYDRNESTLQFAGAFNPLYLIRDGELLETKADRVSIGRSNLGEEVRFQNQVLKVRTGDSVYLFSDGYADQFGGEMKKKFKYKNLKSLLLSIQEEDMETQRILLDETIEKWRGEADQLDDILVIGRKF